MDSSVQSRSATRLLRSTHSSTVISMVGMKGITSVAPIRGCWPWCLVMSMVSAAFFASWKAASSMAAGLPTMVNTHRLWSPSVWTSSTVQPGMLLAVSTRPWNTASSRSLLTLKLGTHSTNLDIFLTPSHRERPF